MSSVNRSCNPRNKKVPLQYLSTNNSSVKRSYNATNKQVHSLFFSQICLLLIEVTMQLISKLIHNKFWEIYPLLKEVKRQLISKSVHNTCSQTCLLLKENTMQLISKFIPNKIFIKMYSIKRSHNATNKKFHSQYL